MISSFNQFSNSLNIHERVKLLSCLCQKYSFSQLNSLGMSVSSHQVSYSKRQEAMLNLTNENSVNLGGPPKTTVQEIEKINNFLFDYSSESRHVHRKSFFYYVYTCSGCIFFKSTKI
jgi:hypothetical protein